ncbi:MFS transporter [Candidatus Gracilibacteria bacterium]|nr:MFS transporter [Candidatus Gracilibacteria bacterium]
MFQIKRRFKISELEATRLRLAWADRFLFQVGFVVAWTIVTALFVENFGVANLLYLFLFDATLYALGAGLASFLLPRIQLRAFLLTAIVGTLALLMASFSFNPEQLEFFVLVILAKDLLFSQVNIALYRRGESLFSPLEAQRFMPLVESAITIGALVGALLVIWFLDFASTQMVLLLWLFSLIIMGGVVFLTPKILHDIPRFNLSKKKKEFIKNPLLEAGHALRKIKFLRHLLLVLVLQTSIFTIIEFEFTKDLQSHVVPHGQEGHLPLENLQSSFFLETKDKVMNWGVEVKEEVVDVSSHLIMHKSLAHDLGMFHLIFAVIALFVQFFTPTVLRKLGVIGSMLSYSSILFVSLGAIIFGYGNINILRSIQHGTHSLGEAPYHITFYSIFSHSREAVRLFLEGIIKPLGMVLGVVVLFWLPAGFIYYAAIIAAGVILLLGLPMKRSFTSLSKENLCSEEDIEGKLHSIEVLGQKGHKNSGIILSDELRNKKIHEVVREKIISTISHINEPRVVHTYLEILRDDKEGLETKVKILDSLFHLKIPKDFWKEHAFTRYHLLETLKHLFYNTDHAHLKKLVVMNIFKHLPSHEIVPFFLETMEQADDKLKAVFLRSCYMFKDPEIAFYVRQYLDHPDPRLKSHAVIALWKFHSKKKLRQILVDLLEEQDEASQISALYAIGEVGDVSSRELLLQFSSHSNPWLRLHSLIALAKLDDIRCAKGLLGILFSEDRELSKAAFHMLDRVPTEMRDHLQKEIQSEVSKQVFAILRPQIQVKIEAPSLSQSLRDTLKHLYWMAGRYDDLLAIESRM